MPTQIFKDTQHDQALLENGYAIVPFLNSDQIQRLKDYFYELHPETPKGLYATAHSPDLEFRKKISDRISEEFKAPCDEWFDDIFQQGGTFIVKGPGQSILDPHQDWNIVDETEFRSFNVWVPLVDVTAENGAVFILEKSHLLMPTFRGPNFPNPMGKIMPEVWKLMVPLEMKAGEALVYDHRLVHGSPRNETETDRLACVFGIKPKDAEMYYYYCREGKVEKYRSSVEFFFEENPEQGPGNLPFVGEEPYDFPEWTAEDLRAWYPEKAHLIPAPVPPAPSKKGFFARLFGG